MTIRRAALFAACLFSSATATAQVPREPLLRPPADARRFAIISAAGQHGTSALWTAADGSQRTRESIRLRGMAWETDEVIGFGPDGRWNNVVVRGVTPSGDAGETFAVANGRTGWIS